MAIDRHPTNYDAIVIGGSYAGLSAALQLARARRRVLVVDAGIRRNRFADTAHGLLGQDGRSPEAIAAEGRDQLLAYPNVRWMEGAVTIAERLDDGFSVSLEEFGTLSAKRLILATGVVDEMPELEGLTERWGKSVFHCPYCHGYELDNGPIGVLAFSPLALHHAMMLTDWGQVTFFLNDRFEPDEEQTTALTARGVAIEAGRVARLVDHATVEMQDGRRLEMAGVFTQCRTRMASPIAEQLGCIFEEGSLGSFIQTDATKETTVPGVFACGDAARMFGSLAMAVGDGAIAGASAHQSMIFR